MAGKDYDYSMELAREYRPIQLLEDGLINQIAAGEVVERPASAVKELLENSLDAGATCVALYLVNGGITEIRLIDNGSGMTPEDLRLCTQRHTTSKIRRAADLEGIGTFGFRGEALSSIASVSKLEIRTRRANEATGFVSKVHFGERIGDIAPCGVSPGTTLIVSELFTNLPARHKYLRSSTTEFSHIARVFREQALGHPEVEFSLTHNDRPTYRFLPGTRPSRVKEVIKPEWELFEVREEADFGQFHAFLTPPHWVSDKGEVTFFVNRRPVKNRSLLAAIRNSYAQTVGPHHEPSGVVYLDVRLDWVDVNVHPQKWEVRCYQQEKIYSWMQAVLKKAIGSAQTLRVFDEPPAWGARDLGPAYRAPQGATLPSPFAPAPSTRPPTLTPTPLPQIVPQPGTLPHTLPSFRYVGQVGASYLVGEDEQGLVLFDQHALHEKLNFEKIREAASGGLGLSQPLLVPQITRLPTELAGAIDKCTVVLRNLGFEAEAFGDGDVAIKAYPVLIEPNEAPDFLRAALTALAEGTTEADTEAWYRRLFATRACHGSVRAGQRLGDSEARALIERLPDLKEGWTCPHGRPALCRLSWDFVGKLFERGKG